MNTDKRRWTIAIVYVVIATCSTTYAADVEFQLRKHPFFRLDSTQTTTEGERPNLIYGKRIKVPADGPQPIQLEFKFHLETKPKYDPIYLLAQGTNLKEQTASWFTDSPMTRGGISFSCRLTSS